MNTDVFEQWLKTTNKGFHAPLGAFSKAGIEMWQQIFAENLEMASENLSRLSDHLKRLTTVKKPEEYLAIMKECINEDMNAVIENSQKVFRHAVEHIEECVKSYGSAEESTFKTVIKEKNKVREREE